MKKKEKPGKIEDPVPRDDAPEEGWWTRFLRRREVWLVGGILLLATLLRVWHFLETKAHDPYFFHPSVDPEVYHKWARGIAAGDVLGDRIFHMGPLYPYFLGGLYSIFGVSFVVARLAQMLLGVGSILLVILLARRVFGTRAALLAGLISAVYPMYLFYEGLLLLAGLQAFLNLCFALAVLAAAKRPRVLRWLAAGCFLGLSALARPNVLPLVFLVLPWMAWELRRGRAHPWRRVLLHAGAFCLGLGLAISPVTIRNYVVSGEGVLISSAGGAQFYLGNGPAADGTFILPQQFGVSRVDHPDHMRKAYREQAERETGRKLTTREVSDFWKDKGLRHIQSDPGRWLGLLVRKLGLFLNSYEIPGNRDYYPSQAFSAVLRLPLPGTGAILPFALLGMVLALTRFRRAFPLFALVFVFAVTLMLFFLLARYRTPVMPFFIAFAGFAVCRVLGFLVRFDVKGLLLAGAGLAAFFAVVHLDLVKPGEFKWSTHYNLAGAYWSGDRIPEAIEEYQQAIEMNPRHLPSHNNLALLYERDPRHHVLAIIHWTAVRNLAQGRYGEKYVERATRHLKALREYQRR